MNSETTRIAGQLRRSYAGPAWSGPSVREVLDGVTADVALRQPGNGTHSIAAITRHIAAWARVASLRLEGEEYPSPIAPKLDWPPPGDDWSAVLAELDQEQKRLEAHVRELDDQCLADLVRTDRDYDLYVLLHGVVQHNLYHAGQIALLRKG